VPRGGVLGDGVGGGLEFWDWLSDKSRKSCCPVAVDPVKFRTTGLPVMAVWGAPGFVAHPPMNIANATKAWTGHFVYAKYSSARRQHLPCSTRSSYGLTVYELAAQKSGGHRAIEAALVTCGYGVLETHRRVCAEEIRDCGPEDQVAGRLDAVIHAFRTRKVQYERGAARA